MKRELNGARRHSRRCTTYAFCVNGFRCFDVNKIFYFFYFRDTIQNDMEVWQTSGQWPFSCYSALKGRISGGFSVGIISAAFVTRQKLSRRRDLINGGCYADCVCLAGFVEVCPEELRLEYYTGRVSGDLQAYVRPRLHF